MSVINGMYIPPPPTYAPPPAPTSGGFGNFGWRPPSQPVAGATIPGMVSPLTPPTPSPYPTVNPVASSLATGTIPGVSSTLPMPSFPPPPYQIPPTTYYGSPSFGSSGSGYGYGTGYGGGYGYGSGPRGYSTLPGNIVVSPQQYGPPISSVQNQYDMQLAAQAQAPPAPPAGPPAYLQDYLNKLQAMASQISSAPGMSNLDPRDAALLNSITANANAQTQATFNKQGQSLINQLYGQGQQNSSTAQQAAYEMAKNQALVSAQTQSDAAQRELAVRQEMAREALQSMIAGAQTLQGAGGMAMQGAGQAQDYAAQNAAQRAQLLSQLSQQAYGRQQDMMNMFRQQQQDYQARMNAASAARAANLAQYQQGLQTSGIDRSSHLGMAPQQTQQVQGDPNQLLQQLRQLQQVQLSAQQWGQNAAPEVQADINMIMRLLGYQPAL